MGVALADLKLLQAPARLLGNFFADIWLTLHEVTKVDCSEREQLAVLIGDNHRRSLDVLQQCDLTEILSFFQAYGGGVILISTSPDIMKCMASPVSL